jgi:hypothetical protein
MPRKLYIDTLLLERSPLLGEAPALLVDMPLFLDGGLVELVELVAVCADFASLCLQSLCHPRHLNSYMQGK